MKTNFKIGLILGITLLMLLPVYARAQIILNNLQGCIAPGTVANITASQGDTMSFVLTSRLPNLSMISDPDKGVTTFPNATNGTSTFTWPTGGSNPVAGGSYLAAFEANNGGTEAEYLVVLITINSSTGGSPAPPLSPATPTTCTYTYSDWTPSPCPSSSVQTRTLTNSSPSECTGTPVTSQSCTYVPPASYNGTMIVTHEGDYKLINDITISQGNTLRYLVTLQQSVQVLKVMFSTYGWPNQTGDISLNITFPQQINTTKGILGSWFQDSSGGGSENAYMQCASGNCFPAGNYIIEITCKSGTNAGQLGVYSY